ncbi:MAG: hypothetical protein WAM73_05960, partial [Desulfobacterales bacterium]
GQLAEFIAFMELIGLIEFVEFVEFIGFKDIFHFSISILTVIMMLRNDALETDERSRKAAVCLSRLRAIWFG